MALAADVEATMLGVSPAYLAACRKAGVDPRPMPGCDCARSAPPGRRSPGGGDVDLRRARRRRPADERQRRYRRVLGDRAGQPAVAGVGRGHLRPLSRRGDGGLRPRRQAGRRRARRVGDHRTDAVDAGRLLERPRRRALPGDVLRPLSGRLATGRLGAVLRERQLRRHRPLRRDAESRRGSPRHRRVLPGRRGDRRSAEQPRRPPRGSRWRAGRTDPVRGPAPSQSIDEDVRPSSPAACAPSCRRVTFPMRSSQSTRSRSDSPARSSSCRSSGSSRVPTLERWPAGTRWPIRRRSTPTSSSPRGAGHDADDAARLSSLVAIDMHVHVEQDGHGCLSLDQELLDASAKYFKSTADRSPTVERLAEHYRACRWRR